MLTMIKEGLLNKINQLDIEVSENYPHDNMINKDEVIRLIKEYVVTSGDDEIKYQVEWKNDRTKEHNKHGVFNTFEEAIDSIYDWWEKNNFKPPYIRRWTEDRVTAIDYGFHNMFYYIVEYSM